MRVSGAWARTSPAVATAGALYLTITNGGEADDALVGVTVDPSVAAKAELHETVAASMEDTSSSTAMGGGTSNGTGGSGEMMEMRPVDRIPVPAGGSVALEPGGYHIMLLDLAEPLQVGATIEVTLTFDAASEMVVTADVRDTAP